MAKRTKKKSIFNFQDFRGGYTTNTPYELMENNEMLQAENVYWNNGLKKRKGISKYASLTGSARGFIRTYTNDAWHTIVAVDLSAGYVEFQQATTTNTRFATITMASGTAYAWTAAKNVEFASLGDEVVAVNGTDRPAAFFPTGNAIYAMDLDQYDDRALASANWYAGKFEAATPAYTNYTAEAQSPTASDFVLASASYSNGFYTSADFTYSKYVITGVDPGAAQSATATYEYFNADSTWVAFGTMNSSGLNASGTEFGSGTCTVEFELPLSTDGTLKWKKYDGNELGATEGKLPQRYVTRTRFAGQIGGGYIASQVNSDQIEMVSHTHYLSQILGDQKPDNVTTHKNHVFMSAKNQVQISAANQIKSTPLSPAWRADRWEYFFEGGNKITALQSFNEYLVVVKNSAMFALTGTSWENWGTRPLGKYGGVAKRGIKSIRGILWMIDHDGLYAFSGVGRVKVCSHIKDDIESYTMTDAVIGEFGNYVYVSFPTNSIVLLFDPDTYRVDQIGNMGNGKVSLYKYTSFLANGFGWSQGSADNGKFLFLGTNYIGQAEDGNSYDNITGTTTINMQLQTKYFDLGGGQTEMLYNRVKPRVGDVTHSAGENYTFKMLKSDETGGASASVALTAGVGTGYHQQDLLVPAKIDGKFIGFYLQHDTPYNARFLSVSVDARERRY
jgi:hypothetical protein